MEVELEAANAEELERRKKAIAEGRGWVRGRDGSDL